MPEAVDADALQTALTALSRSGANLSGASPGSATLAYRVLGAAEGQAMRAVSGRAGDGVDREVLIAEALGAAGCESELDALAALRWQAARLAEALRYLDLGGPYGVRDPMMGTIITASAALARMVDSAYVMRDHESNAANQREAAEAWWTATESLRQALTTGEAATTADEGHEGHDHGPQGCPNCL